MTMEKIMSKPRDLTEQERYQLAAMIICELENNRAVVKNILAS